MLFCKMILDGESGCETKGTGIVDTRVGRKRGWAKLENIRWGKSEESFDAC